MKQHPKWVEFMREQYPLGTRIRLTEMRDPYAPVPPGTEGTVIHIDDACQFHMKWDNGRTLALIPGVDHFSVIPQPLQTLKLYMPLTVTTYERNKWGDLEDDPIELDNREILKCADNILAGLVRERRPEEAERGLMTYYGDEDSISRKVQSYVFIVEKINGRLMGVAECQIRGELTEKELGWLKENADYCRNQFPHR